jgi:hypothetical protein
MTHGTQRWKIAVRNAVAESGSDFDNENLRDLVLLAEGSLFLRQREIEGSSDHHEERGEMKTATAVLLAIKTEKLGYPKI